MTRIKRIRVSINDVITLTDGRKIQAIPAIDLSCTGCCFQFLDGDDDCMSPDVPVCCRTKDNKKERIIFKLLNP